MKKGIVAIILLAICLSLVCPAFAEEFVPSISYKPAPEVDGAEMEIPDETGDDLPPQKEEVEICLVVTSLKQAEDKSTDISEEAREELLEVYEELESGDMELPITEEGFVVRELVDVSWELRGCVEDDEHHHDEMLERPNVTVKVNFQLGVKAGVEVMVYTFNDNQWSPVESVTNNGDGSVTCVMEHFCPVAFAVKEETGGTDTGDAARESLVLWGVLMAVSAAAVVVLAISRKKYTR